MPTLQRIAELDGHYHSYATVLAGARAHSSESS